jgi:hypothetical protein
MQNDMRDRLVKLLDVIIQPGHKTLGDIADHLIANGVIIPPCKIGDDIWVLKGDINNGWETLKPTHTEKVNGGFRYDMLDTNGNLKSIYYMSKEQAEQKIKTYRY